MKALIFAFAFAALMASGETLRLKATTTVEIVDEAGKVIGQKKLKAGTVIAPVDSAAPAAAAPGKKGKRLVPAEISPMMFKTTRPANATLRAAVKLTDIYSGKFEGQRAKYWSIDIFVYDAKWENSELFIGYIPKSTPLGKKFADFVKDGNTHRSVVKVAFVKDDTFDDLLEIQDFEPLPTPE